MVYRRPLLSSVTVLVARLIALLVLPTLLLSSCAHLPGASVATDTDPDDWTEDLSASKPAGRNRSQLTDVENSLYRIPVWQLSGRLSIRSKDEVLSGSLRWRQQKDRFIINFNAPFGQGALQIKGDAVGVELETADGRSLQADDLDQLFEEAAGWDLPLSGLRYWVFGIPSPDSDAGLQREPGLAVGPITEIRQSDWVVAIPRYVQIGVHSLPRKLRLRSTGLSNELQVRLVIDRWQLENEAASN